VIVTFRPLRTADSAQVLAWRNSPEVSAYMFTDHQIAPEDHARWLAGVLSAEDRRYWIIEADGAPVGLANIAGIDSAARRCELGHYIADPSMRGRGVGACAEYIILQHVFETLNLNKLWCEVLIENRAAWALHLSFGFQREAHFRAHVLKGGRFRDVLGLGVLAEEWVAIRPSCEARFRAKRIDPSTLQIRGA
jgi:UDP-4-amino-4,6-dideoxy-N-acetyl-beta-L-altrosamine N-acetyltransferase